MAKRRRKKAAKRRASRASNDSDNAEVLHKGLVMIGVVFAVLVGFIETFGSVPADARGWIYGIIILIGLVIGLVNVTTKDIIPFLFAGLVVVLLKEFGDLRILEIPYADLLQNIFSDVTLLIVPAVIIVALRELYILVERS